MDLGKRSSIQILSSIDDPDEKAQDDDASRLLKEMLCQETTGRGRPKALCYEDVLLMVVRHPDAGTDVLAMSIKFIHHKGADNNPKPYVRITTIFPWPSALVYIDTCQDHILLYHGEKGDTLPN